MNTLLHVGRPSIGNRERFLQRVNEILDRRWLSNNGPIVQKFEKRVARILGVKNGSQGARGQELIIDIFL